MHINTHILSPNWSDLLNKALYLQDKSLIIPRTISTLSDPISATNSIVGAAFILNGSFLQVSAEVRRAILDAWSPFALVISVFSSILIVGKVEDLWRLLGITADLVYLVTFGSE